MCPFEKSIIHFELRVSIINLQKKNSSVFLSLNYLSSIKEVKWNKHTNKRVIVRALHLSSECNARCARFFNV